MKAEQRDHSHPRPRRESATFLFVDEEVPGTALQVEIVGLSSSEAMEVLACHGPKAVFTGHVQPPAANGETWPADSARS